MGIFDVVNDELKDKSLSSEKVLQALKSAGINTTGIKVQITDGVVSLAGIAVSEAEKSKIVKLIDEIEGVKSIQNKLFVSKDDESDETVYTVKSGDTLSGIAKQFYGNANKYTIIFEHNKQVWSDHGKKQDPNILFPGWKLIIPQI